MAETRERDGRFRKGISGNPSGATRLDRMVVFDLKQAARAHCKEAIEIIAREMHNKDARVRLLACQLMIERGYGRPEVKADVDVVHKFVRVPEVMEQEAWLKHRGQPQLDGKAVREVCPDAAPTLDTKLSDEPDSTKLN